jgi:carbonic anhydrase
MAHWGYSGHLGPAEWHTIAPAAAGHRQSPIVIDAGEADYNEKLKKRPLHIHFDHDSAKTITNNGHSVQVDFVGDDCTLSGGPLKEDKYILKQFHFHWGSNNSHGSEHKVNGKAFAAELHMVFWNKTRFSSYDEAVKSDNGMCVLTTLIEAGGHHEGFDKLFHLISKVDHSGEHQAIPGGFNPTVLLPADKQRYWTYKGSLTTPPCYESVRFIIFRHPIHFSDHQLATFRTLKSGARGSECHHLVDNFRPTQPLHGRKVKASFKSVSGHGTDSD